MNPRTCFAGKVRLLVVALTLLTANASAEWKEKVLYSFQGGTDGATPAGGVVFDQHGNLYGTTLDGGSSSCPSPQQCGTVYQLAPPAQQAGAWTEIVLYIFKGHDQNDGASPEGGLIIDNAGNLYGTTGYGGSGPCILLGTAVGCGTVFELSPPAKQGDPWKETVLYSFQGSKDGYVPFGDLVFDKLGNLYGATLYGGGLGYDQCDKFYGYCGTIFRLTPPKTKGGKWTEKVLHSFAGGTDGANPNGGLIFDSKGAIYGTTPVGGNQLCNFGQGDIGCGVVFELGPPGTKSAAWAEQILHRFTDRNDGAAPNGNLILDAKGQIYGTTGGGGDGNGFGVVFRLSPRLGRWEDTTLYSFQGRSDGRGPAAPITFDRIGDLYGTANAGGSYSGGTFFRLKEQRTKRNEWTFALLYSFMGPPDAEFPASPLIFDRTGNLCGTTSNGGNGQKCQGGCGTVFSVGP